MFIRIFILFVVSLYTGVLFAPPRDFNSTALFGTDEDFLEVRTVVSAEFEKAFMKLFKARENPETRKELLGVFLKAGPQHQGRMLLEWSAAGENLKELTDGLPDSVTSSMLYYSIGMTLEKKYERLRSQILPLIQKVQIGDWEKKHLLTRLGKLMDKNAKIAQELADTAEKSKEPAIRAGALIGLSLTRVPVASRIRIISEAMHAKQTEVFEAGLVAAAYTFQQADKNPSKEIAELRKQFNETIANVSEVGNTSMAHLLEALPFHMVEPFLKKLENPNEAQRLLLRIKNKSNLPLQDREHLEQLLLVGELRDKWADPARNIAAIATRILSKVRVAKLLEMIHSPDPEVSRMAKRLAKFVMETPYYRRDESEDANEVRRLARLTFKPSQTPENRRMADREAALQSDDANKRRNALLNVSSDREIPKPVLQAIYKVFTTETDTRNLSLALNLLKNKLKRSSEAKSFVLKCMQSSDWEVARKAIVVALEKFPEDAEIQKAIVPFLKHKNLLLAEAAATGLARLVETGVFRPESWKEVAKSSLQILERRPKYTVGGDAIILIEAALNNGVPISQVSSLLQMKDIADRVEDREILRLNKLLARVGETTYKRNPPRQKPTGPKGAPPAYVRASTTGLRSKDPGQRAQALLRLGEYPEFKANSLPLLADAIATEKPVWDEILNASEAILKLTEADESPESQALRAHAIKRLEDCREFYKDLGIDVHVPSK